MKSFMPKSRWKNRLFPVVLAVLLSGMRFFGGPDAGAAEMQTPASEPGALSAGFEEKPSKITITDDHSFAPFAFLDADGKPAGITIDIWKLWSRKTGIDVEFHLMEWEKALTSVRKGDVDAVGGLFRTPDREAYYDFTKSFFVITTSIFFHQKIKGIRGLQDLEGFPVGVVRGDAAERLVQEHHPYTVLMAYPDAEEMVHAAVNGEINVFVVDTAVGHFYLAKLDTSGEFREASGALGTNKQYAAVAKGNQKLLSTLQQGLDAISAEEVEAIVDAWAGHSYSLVFRIPWVSIGIAVGAAGLIFVLILFWNVQLKRRITDALKDADRHSEALRESEASFKALFDLVPFGCTVNDFNGRYRMVNRAFCERMGRSAEEIIGQTSKDLGVMLDKEAVKKATEDLARTGEALNREATIMKPDGQTAHIFFSSRVVDLGGSPVVLSATVDITDRKQAERVLRESEYRFRTYFNSNPEGVVLLAHDGKILDTNRALCRMSGYREEELIGRHYADFLPTENLCGAEQAFQTLWAGILQEDPVEISLLKKGGGELAVALRGWRVTDERSTPVALGIFIQDRTREKRLKAENEKLEKQLQQTHKMEAIGTLAGGIAHDFNNILSAIFGYTEIAMIQLPEDSGIASKLTRVLEASQRAKDLVNQILTFSRMDELSSRPVSSRLVVKEALKLLRASIPATIDFKEKIGQDACTVMADPTQLHRIVMNLCTNAYHAMMAEGGTLTVSLLSVVLDSGQVDAYNGLKAGRHIQLMVADTGIGIPTEIQDKIFEPYFTTKQRGEGTGMGLSVVHGIVKKLGGDIRVSSELGNGTEFTVWIPQIEETAREEDGPARVIEKGSESILLVDDERVLTEMMGEMLKDLGYRVTIRTSSYEASEAFKINPHQFDLVITDYAMPKMSGEKLAQEIKAMRDDIPIILCSGFSESISKERMKHLGIKRNIKKPVLMKELALAIQEVLAGPKE